MQIFHFCASSVDVEADGGGVSNVVAALARESSAAGHPTTIICGTHDLRRRVSKPGYDAIGRNLSVHTIDDGWASLWSLPARLQQIVSKIPQGAAVHVHGCFSLFADITMWLLRKYSVPYIASPHGKLTRGMMASKSWAKRFWLGLFTRENFLSAKVIGALSVGEASDLRHFVDGRIIVVPNGFAVPVDLNNRSSRYNESPYVLFLGYLDPRKQPDFLIRCYAACESRHTHKLLLVGPDGYGFANKLMSIAQDCGVGKKVHFLGVKRGAEKWDLLARATLLCLPSKAEGFPLVIIEAAGVGTPSLYSRQCNVPELAAVGGGIELDSFEVSAWSAALDGMISDQTRLNDMRKAAIDFSKRYSWPMVFQAWLAVYAQACATKTK